MSETVLEVPADDEGSSMTLASGLLRMPRRLLATSSVSTFGTVGCVGAGAGLSGTLGFVGLS